jgi:cystathionine gamma-synthase
MKKINKDTITSRAGVESDKQYGSVVPPLYLSSNFTFDEVGHEPEYEYTRCANPTRDILTNALSDIEGGLGGEVTSSGMAAISLVANILDLNASVLLPHDCYGGTHRLFSSLKEKGVLDIDFINQGDLQATISKINEVKPALIWLETPSNPLLQVVDIQAISASAKLTNTMIAVDNTFLSPALQNPLKLGADIVVHSTTKYINGHSDVIGGAAITSNEEILTKLKYWANNLGLTGSPFDSYQTMRGLRTLSLRMEKHEKNANALVEVLSNNKKVAKVYYPGLSHHPSHDIAKKQQSGFGAMLSFELEGGLPAAKKFFKEIKIFSLAESLGGFESLVCHPYTMTHAPLSAEEKEAAGISEGLIRISAGLEDADDLIDDINGALKKL